MMGTETNIPSKSDFIRNYLFRQRLMLGCVWGFIGGVFISSFVFISPLAAVLFILVSLSIFLAEKVWSGEVNKEVVLLVAVVVAFSLGVVRFDIKDFHEINPELISNVGNNITLSGVVVSEPEARESSTRFVLDTETERVLVYTDLYSRVEYGDRIEATGKLGRPGIIDDGVGRAFDYAKFLSKDDIYFTMSFTEIETLAHGEGNPIKAALFKIKSGFVSKAREIFAEPYASLLSGLVVSGKDAMPQGILDNFRKSGLIHIVVLSGYNITIIAEFLRKMFTATWSPRVATYVSILAVLLFVVMTGAEATVTRAAVMVLVVILAKQFGKSYSAPRALLGAGFVMVLLNPKILVFDPSFQLSFLATCGLIYLTPIFERLLRKVPERLELRTVLATTIATQLAVLPFLIYSMGEVSLVSLPANILVLIFIPYTMLAGFLATIVGFLSPLLALPFSLVSQAFLSWILSVSGFLGNLSFASIVLPQTPFILTALVYIVGIIFLWRLRTASLPQSS